MLVKSIIMIRQVSNQGFTLTLSQTVIFNENHVKCYIFQSIVLLDFLLMQ